MPSLDDHFRALSKVRPPDRWPELGEREPRPLAPPPALGRRLGVAALALAVAAGGLVFAVRAFRSDQRPQRPAAPVENGLIAFSRGGPEAGLYVVNPDGTGVSRLTTAEVDTDSAWSPDGSTIAFVRGFWDRNAGVYVMDADGSDPRRITDGGSLIDGSDVGPAWSPDGTKIAFAREGRESGAETGNADIYSVSPYGTGLVRLTDGPAMEYEPAWSPDGSRIAFEGYDLAAGGEPPSPVRLYVMNADGTGVTEVGPQNVQGPAWSPDGSEIAYVDTESGSIMAVRTDGSGQRRILDVAAVVGGVHLVYDVAWSPDGTKLVFMAGPEDTDTHIFVVNPDGTGLAQLTDERAPDHAPAWQPVPLEDGTPTPEPDPLPEGTISLPADAVPEGSILVWTDVGAEILRAGSARSRLVPEVRRPLDVSPDGSVVLGSNMLPGSPADELVAVDLRSGEGRVLARAEGDDVFGAFARWSPDASMVAYTVGAPDPAARSTLCVVSLAVGEPTCFPDIANVLDFDWSPDGRRLVVAAGWSVGILDAATGEFVEIVTPREGNSPIGDALRDAGLGTFDQLVGPSWSPSGTYLAALARLRDSEFAYVPVVFTPDGEFVAFGRASGEFPEPFAWSPVAGVLAYTQGEAPYRITEAYLLDPATGEDRLIRLGDTEDPFVLTDMSWAPSGRWLAIAGWVDRGQGYFETSLVILDPADPSSVRRFPIDTGDASGFLAGWGP